MLAALALLYVRICGMVKREVSTPYYHRKLTDGEVQYYSGVRLARCANTRADTERRPCAGHMVCELGNEYEPEYNEGCVQYGPY